MATCRLIISPGEKRSRGTNEVVIQPLWSKGEALTTNCRPANHRKHPSCLYQLFGKRFDMCLFLTCLALLYHALQGRCSLLGTV